MNVNLQHGNTEAEVKCPGWQQCLGHTANALLPTQVHVGLCPALSRALRPAAQGQDEEAEAQKV